jgi:copper chaperone CopZ
MNTLTIHGMHCRACEKLIRIELEEHALDQYIDHIELYSDQKKGIMTLTENTSQENIAKMITVISGMDAYTVTRE